MELPLYQLDAFTSTVFAGNPAAVCPLEEWLADDLMQSIAAENNLSETAFLVRSGDDYAIRWFTPAVEVDLCGHATLASGALVLDRLQPGRDAVCFESRSGELHVRRAGERFELDFPARPPEPCERPAHLVDGLGAEPAEVLRAPYLLAVFPAETDVRALTPDFKALARVGTPVIASAPGDEVDFVSRFFAPGVGIDEDPVTGSAHCTLTPYWSKRLGKKELVARQVSERGGEVHCVDAGERTRLSGHVAFYLEGRIHV